MDPHDCLLLCSCATGSESSVLLIHFFLSKPVYAVAYVKRNKLNSWKTDPRRSVLSTQIDGGSPGSQARGAHPQLGVSDPLVFQDPHSPSHWHQPTVSASPFAQGHDTCVPGMIFLSITLSRTEVRTGTPKLLSKNSAPDAARTSWCNVYKIFVCTWYRILSVLAQNVISSWHGQWKTFLFTSYHFLLLLTIFSC